MLTRLKVNGFKNLVDVDVRFGPFTCIAGVNGSGKSNLFDAIRFLAALAEKPLVEAALSIRGGSRSSDIRDLFHRVGDQYAEEMSFEVEMIIPAEGIDDLGQPIRAGSTMLKYCLKLEYRPPGQGRLDLPLRITKETLDTIGSDAARKQALFRYDEEWWSSAILSDAETDRHIFAVPGPWRMSENGHPVTPPDRSDTLIPAFMPRTVLSVAAANPALASDGSVVRIDLVTLARQEMQSWSVLELDADAIRKPNDLTPKTEIGIHGENTTSLLYGSAAGATRNGEASEAIEAAVYARVRNRLFRLIGEMREIRVDWDDKREELTLYATDRDGTTLPARALSDGTLRFLALAVLEQQEQPGLYCIEEPENGIHPGRIESLLKLLQAIAMDTAFPIEEGNPLRQVIISTHSPSVVMRVPEDTLIVAELWPSHDDRGRFKRARFRGLAKTWRDPEPDRNSVALATLLDYLNPEGYRPLPGPDPERDPDAEVRVMDREDLHRLFDPVLRVDG